MDLSNGESVSELIQAQADVLNHAMSFIKSMSLKCALELGIPDIIQSHGKPMTLSELAAALPLHPARGDHSVHRLMRVLVHTGIFALQKVDETGHDQEEGYVLTHASRLLLKDTSLSCRPFILGILDPDLTKPWHFMSTWFQNDDPAPFKTAHGRALYDYAGHEPRINLILNEAMASDSQLAIKAVISKCKGVFEGLQSLADVGGGTGTMAAAIAQEFPTLECIVFDLPHVVAHSQDRDNLKFLGGDMFEAVPPADAILLKWILHNWNDAECVKILKRCKEAITRNGKIGKVIIMDIIMGHDTGDKRSVETQLLCDMAMMVVVQGQERNEKEWAKIFSEAGFSHYKIYPKLGFRSLLEVYP
ncbi:Methyltransf_2 domain-containing protein/Dimerisation domain-containing protein [Cephalotus follicularis]|uniref:Methyltransf_2 domain-containing protein/Dimerisation domain-containing protein n=1 Tax=Cephalotus follicularis TaxID=3775 RepID=A0A1Q3AWS7_CEPFO|nr:Methyltransf_2 domain-containing protein/Dimerisation domain-containing protein [Cephalotus follicularis]